MEYAVQMVLGTMIYMPSFVEICSIIRKLMGGYADAQTGWRSYKPTLMLFKIRKVVYKSINIHTYADRNKRVNTIGYKYRNYV
jgi:hypothetical protein